MQYYPTHIRSTIFITAFDYFMKMVAVDAYIVSVGSYGAGSGKAQDKKDYLLNANVKIEELLAGLDYLKQEQEPTMYICPEATLLSKENNARLMQAMLLQSAEMKTAISFFDIHGAKSPDPKLFLEDIEAFQMNTGTEGLSYGVAYYPFLSTTMMQPDDVDHRNLFGGDLDQLAAIINPKENANPAVTTIFASMISEADGNVARDNHKAMRAACKSYKQVIDQVLDDINIMPATAAIAGVIATTDNSVGPWQAPANCSLAGVKALTIDLSDKQQGSFNTDITAKSINVIRNFSGRGILIWGARTLDSNSMDWRYISVRRTAIYIEQSCLLAIHAYVFAANSANTWVTIKASIQSFLTSVWSQGGLMGNRADDAFSVDCGLGSTMTAEDILNGRLIVTVKVAIVHPAEFIELTFQQQMQNN